MKDDDMNIDRKTE